MEAGLFKTITYFYFRSKAPPRRGRDEVSPRRLEPAFAAAGCSINSRTSRSWCFEPPSHYIRPMPRLGAASVSICPVVAAPRGTEKFAPVQRIQRSPKASVE